MRQLKIRTIFLVLAVSMVTSAAFAADEEEGGGEETAAPVSKTGSKTLAERIPSVTGRAFVKAGRVEIGPNVGLTLNDPFFRHTVLGASLAYNIWESLSVGVWGNFFLDTSRKVTIVGSSQRRPKLNHPNYVAAFEIAWAPLYGKVSLLAESIMHFDTYLGIGGGILSGSESSTTGMGSIALGEHFFLNDWLGLKIELRDQIFQMDRNPAQSIDSGVKAKTDIQHLLTASVGLCFYLPTSFQREQL